MLCVGVFCCVVVRCYYADGRVLCDAFVCGCVVFVVVMCFVLCVLCYVLLWLVMCCGVWLC